jgi:hypothetical protein
MLQAIIDRAVGFFGLSPEIAQKLISYIDLQKIKGMTEPYASSKFADYLGFLQIPDTQEMQTFFAERWGDYIVWTQVPKEYMKFLNPEGPLFTPSRLEPHYRERRFYESGVPQVPMGKNTNTHNEGSVRTIPAEKELYQNFVVYQFLPEFFYFEAPNEWVPSMLHEGLPAVEHDKPYRLHLTVEEARADLHKHLFRANHQMISKTDLLSHTLVQFETSKLVMNGDVFFTQNDLMQGSARSAGYFYIGQVPSNAIQVSSENITG